MTEPTIWTKCYSRKWNKGEVDPDTFKHPARFAPKLIERIVKHGLERGWWKRGDLLIDPFGGVAMGGFVAARHGLRWLGMELEPHFHATGNRNIDLWGERERITLVQGDSRYDFSKAVANATGAVLSPPYAGTDPRQNSSSIDRTKQWESYRAQGGGQSLEAFSATQDKHSQGYGVSDGQMGAMKIASVTSPPFENSLNSKDRSFNADARAGRTDQCSDYGTSTGQIGVTSGDDYWSACRLVYEQLRAVLPPGGMACIVVKDFVKKGKRYPLCDMTLALLESLGFKLVERIHAIIDEQEPGLFGTIKKSRKGFFRKMYEARPGAVKIDFEEVLYLSAPA
ncbi:MAG: DNA methyltransferase [Planctomycetaceae bacterium]